jgi:hypothetical protein
MQEFLWLDHLPNETIEGGIELANELYWNITLKEGGQQWCVWGGEKPIFCTDSREAVDAFLYGLGLAYSVLPEPVFEQLKEEVKRWVE